MPPLALMSATYISSVFFSGSPRKDAGPVTERMAPILISACAALAAVASSAAAMVRKIIRMTFLPAGGPFGPARLIGRQCPGEWAGGSREAIASPVRQRPVFQPRDRQIGRVIRVFGGELFVDL